ISLSEDPRTLQLALELSLVGLNDNQACYVQQQSVQPLASVQSDYEMANINSKTDNSNMALTSSSSSCFLLPTVTGTGTGMVPLEDRSKKSQNMTECVPVPSSEHVAEIVGRQGCKIKALRAKTNTYIKTPVRGEEPVFVVTGRKEDVSKAKREILSAADHFSLIRASRKPLTTDAHTSSGGGGVAVGGCVNGSGSGSSSSSGIGAVPRLQSGPPCLPGQITIQVRVPYRVVGLVVGPKGATIKHIQQETQTYIVTPSREKEPIFEVTGLPDNVNSARKQIEAHIALRTGVGLGTGTGSSSYPVLGSESSSAAESNSFINSNTMNSLTQILNDDLNTELLTSIYKNVHQDYAHNSIHQMKPIIQNYQLNDCYKKQEDISDTELMSPTLTASGISAGKHNQLMGNETKAENCVFRNTSKALPTSILATTTSNHANPNTNNILTRSCSSASSTTSTKSTNNSTNANTPPEILNIWKNLNDSIDVDEGIGDSPSIWSQSANIVLSTDHHHQCSPANSVSPTDSLLEQQTIVHHTLREPNQQQKTQAQAQAQAQAQVAIQPVQSGSTDKFVIHRECCVCNENQVTTALVPCGHNMFCMECANQICASLEAVCPICNSIVYHAMRILG
ncbi:hypothetical protein KR059_012051, partial [Drosophila kikkawai]